MPIKKTTEEFIADARKVHGNRYDYSKVIYVNTSTKVCIVCHQHGDFWQIPDNHLHGANCPLCGALSRIKNNTETREIFLEKALTIHGSQYDYSKVQYQGSRIKVLIKCKDHGFFWQTPAAHVRGQGCPICGKISTAKQHLSDQETCISRFRSVHGDKYDYSETHYNKSHEKVIVICPDHGPFMITPDAHCQGQGCPKCGRKRINEKRTVPLEAELDLFRKVHGTKYDYSKVQYVNKRKKIEIVCPEHGSFWQTPAQHQKGQGCPRCSGKHQYSTEEYIVEANKVHHNKYDYSEVDYINNSTKIKIICHEHGCFWQTPNSHLRGNGCPACAGLIPYNTESFISKANDVHGGKYDYSLSVYNGHKKKISIVCPTHGLFLQTPNSHLRGSGCPSCANVLPLNNELFIEKAIEVHGNKYDYSRVNYVRMSNKVCIICPKHGEFWQTAGNHLTGYGCPICNSSWLESDIRKLLINNNISFVEQQTFEWLRDKAPLKLDFYIADKKVAIECQGKQHFKTSEYWGGDEALQINIRRDQVKLELCMSHGVKILYYSNLGINYPYQVFENKDDLLRAILCQNE